MAVERVVAGVDHGAGEPAAVKPHRGIEHLFRRLDPVDLARRLAPKALGIGERTGMDLVIAAGVLDVHGVAPSAVDTFASIRHARPCAGHPRLSSFEDRKTWMAGTSPAMTVQGDSRPCSSVIVTGSGDRSSLNSCGCCAPSLLPDDAVELVQPLFHAPCADRIAGRPNEALRLSMKSPCSALQRRRQARWLSYSPAARLPSGTLRVDLAVEIGQLGIGADRLLHRTLLLSRS